MNIKCTKLGAGLLLLILSLQSAAAFYDPGLQRWLNRDPIEDLGFRLFSGAVPGRLAPGYIYSGNAPLNNLDPFGLMFAPPGSADTGYLDNLSRCIAIGNTRRREFNRLAREGRLRAGADRWYHCVTSCEMTRACGAAEAEFFGSLHEWWYGGTREDTRADQAANAQGRGCGRACQDQSCEECCESKGYRR